MCGLWDRRNGGELHKSPKVVDFVEAASFAEAISKSLVDFLDFRPLGPPKWREPHKSPKVVDFVIPLLLRKPFPRPSGFPGCPAPRTAEMERTSQKPKSCRFCRVRSFCGSHFQGPSGFHGFPASGRDPNKSPKVVDFVESAPFVKAVSKAPVDFRPLEPPKWRELHKSSQIVDFAEPAPFAEAISKAFVDFLDFRPLRPPKCWV